MTSFLNTLSQQERDAFIRKKLDYQAETRAMLLSKYLGEDALNTFIDTLQKPVTSGLSSLQKTIRNIPLTGAASSLTNKVLNQALGEVRAEEHAKQIKALNAKLARQNGSSSSRSNTGTVENLVKNVLNQSLGEVRAEERVKAVKRNQIQIQSRPHTVEQPQEQPESLPEGRSSPVRRRSTDNKKSIIANVDRIMDMIVKIPVKDMKDVNAIKKRIKAEKTKLNKKIRKKEYNQNFRDEVTVPFENVITLSEKIINEFRGKKTDFNEFISRFDNPTFANFSTVLLKAQQPQQLQQPQLGFGLLGRSGHGILKKNDLVGSGLFKHLKNKPYTVHPTTGLFGGLKILVRDLIKNKNLMVHRSNDKNKKLIVNTPVDSDTVDLLLKSPEKKREYSGGSVQVLKHLTSLSGLAPAKNSVKYRMMKTGGQVGENELINRLIVLTGEVMAGNNNVGSDIETVAKKLRDIGRMTKKQFTNIIKRYVKN